VISRRSSTLLATALALVVACGTGAALWRFKAPSYVRHRLEQITGHRVSIGGLHLSARLEIVATDVRVAGAPPFESQSLARAERVVVRLRGPGGFWSPSEVVVDGLDIEYLATTVGDNLRSPTSSAARHQPAARTQGSQGFPHILVHNARVHGSLASSIGPRINFRAPSVEIERDTNGHVQASLDRVVVDVEHWLTLRAQGLALQLDHGQLVVVSPGQVSVEMPGGGPVLEDLALRATAATSGTEFDLQSRDGQKQKFHLRARLDAQTADVSLDGQDLPLRAFAAWGARPTLGFEKAKATLRAAVVLDRATLLADYRFDGTVVGLDCVHPALDTTPWRDQSASLRLHGQADLGSRRIKVTEGTVKALAATFTLSGAVELGATLRGSLVIATPEDAPLSCASLLMGQPAPIQRALSGFAVDGKLGLQVSLGFDAGDWEALRLGIEVAPLCSVKSEPRSLADLLPVLRKPPKDGLTRLPLGPAHPDYVPLAKMPKHLPGAFLTSEDSKFFHHHGFDTEMIRHALAQDLENHSFDRGASTITQQLAKNLFLSQKRTLARKLEEAVLTWRLQNLLSKDRVLEVYLNVIELGPGIQGVKQAARVYFGKDVANLTPLESAHLAALTPNPHALARRFRDGQVDEGWLQRLYDLLGMMKRHGRLSAEELATARTSNLVLRNLGDDGASHGKQ
jgi:Transglycosylase